MKAELLEERTVYKIVVPVRIKRIGLRLNLDETPNRSLRSSH